jgi:TorA maturation chaperone TorD
METMNAVNQAEIGTAKAGGRPAGPVSPAVERAQLYHFFELALAHPGEEGVDYFRQETTELAFLEAYNDLLGDNQQLLAKGLMSARAFFSRMRNASYEEVEAAHIALFSANYPHLPCPPYGSLFTAEDSDKRLEHMLAIKAFYQRNGVDIADTFKDLPDHLCVELEFSQLLCFREDEAAMKEDGDVLSGIQGMQAEFLDKFMLPLGTRLTELAAAAMPENLYSDLLEALRCFLLQHRREFDPAADTSLQAQEIKS